MVEYYCDGSYSEEKMMVGFGIIKVDGTNRLEYFYHESGMYWRHFHEIFAIYNALLLIEKQQEKKAIIYNDQTELVRIIKRKEKSAHWELKVLPIMEKVEKLRQQGFRITFQNAREGQQLYVKQAHAYSRMYLNEPKDRKRKKELKEITTKSFLNFTQKEQQQLQEVRITAQTWIDSSKVKKMQKEMAKKIQVVYTPTTKKITTKKEFTRKPSTVKRMELQQKHANLYEIKEVNQEQIKKSNQYSFVKVSNRKWAVFNSEGELLYAANHILDVSYVILKEGIRYHDSIHINKSFFSSYETFMLLEDSKKEQHQEKAKQVYSWLNQKNIMAI